VIALGMIALPAMLRYGYHAKTATGVIAATGTITQLVPPSLTLLVLADQLGKPVGDMYAGAIGPSIAQTLIFMLYILALSWLRPQWVPPLPPEARTLRGWALVARVLWGVVPAMSLIFLVLGTIFLGLATPTEAGAMGAVGALVLAAVRGRLTRTLVWQGMETTMRLSSMVIFILIGATVFSLVFQGVDGPHWVEGLLGDLPGGQVGFLIVVSLFIFVLAFFLDFFEIAFIVVPLLAPVAHKLGIDLIWFGVLLCVLLQTSFMHPPFGFALFYLRGITPPRIKSGEIYLGALPWVGLQLMVVALVIAAPQLVTMFFDAGPVIDMEKAGEDVRRQIERALQPQ
jgi:tripartite ATP-independent transporter DctM subunit